MSNNREGVEKRMVLMADAAAEAFKASDMERVGFMIGIGAVSMLAEIAMELSAIRETMGGVDKGESKCQ